MKTAPNLNLEPSASAISPSMDACCICLEEIGAPQAALEDTVVILECGHKFHRHCIKDWKEEQSTCPLCRAPFRASSQISPKPALSFLEIDEDSGDLDLTCGYSLVITILT